MHYGLLFFKILINIFILDISHCLCVDYSADTLTVHTGASQTGNDMPVVKYLNKSNSLNYINGKKCKKKKKKNYT